MSVYRLLRLCLSKKKGLCVRHLEGDSKPFHRVFSTFSGRELAVVLLVSSSKIQKYQRSLYLNFLNCFPVVVFVQRAPRL